MNSFHLDSSLKFGPELDVLRELGALAHNLLLQRVDGATSLRQLDHSPRIFGTLLQVHTKSFKPTFVRRSKKRLASAGTFSSPPGKMSPLSAS